MAMMRLTLHYLKRHRNRGKSTGTRRSDPAAGCTKPAELGQYAGSRHPKRTTKLHQLLRGTSHDAYASRNACLRRNLAPLTHACAQSGRSEPAAGCTKPAELGHYAGSRHPTRTTRLHQLLRGTSNDAYASRNACLRRNLAPLTHACAVAVHLCGPITALSARIGGRRHGV